MSGTHLKSVFAIAILASLALIAGCRGGGPEPSRELSRASFSDDNALVLSSDFGEAIRRLSLPPASPSPDQAGSRTSNMACYLSPTSAPRPGKLFRVERIDGKTTYVRRPAMIVNDLAAAYPGAPAMVPPPGYEKVGLCELMGGTPVPAPPPVDTGLFLKP